MTNKPEMEFLVDKSKNTINIRREFAAQRQLVWDCYTRGELLERWFGPEPYHVKTRTMNFSEGGHWLYAMVSPEGAEHWGRFDYQKIRPIDEYQALAGFCDADGAMNPDAPRSQWNVKFSGKADLTLVEMLITHSSAESLEMILKMGLQEGWAVIVKQLDGLLADLSR